MRRPHIIADNKKTQYPRHLILFDTETPNEEGKTHDGEQQLYVGVACYVHLPQGKEKYKEEWITFEQPSDFWKFVEKHHRRKEKLYLFAHNTRYDLPVVKGYSYLKKLGYKIIFDTFDSVPCIIRARKEGWGSIEILDTFNYFKSSIDALGDMFNIPKLAMPEGIKDKRVWAEYCKRDVEICKTAIISFINLVRSEDLGNFGHTIAKQAFNAYRHKFMKYPIYVHDFPDVIEIERKAYKGGRSEAFYIGVLTPPAIGYDINSAYPHVMKKYNYPTRYHHKEKNISIERLNELMKEYLVIADISFSIDKPCVGIKRHKLIFPVGNIREVVTTPEIKLITQYGKIKNIHLALCYEHSPIFSDYIDYFYNKRMAAKKEGNNVMSSFYKYLLNSLYGKFGQRSEKWERVTDNYKMPDGNYHVVDSNTGEKLTYRVVNGVLWIKRGFVEGYNTFVAISAFVTAYQRCELWKYMEKIPEDMLYYVDTDSLWIHPEAEKYLKPYEHDYELGLLKKEDSKIERIDGVKLYYKDGKRHYKGIRVDAKEIGKGVFEQIQFKGIKSAIREGMVDKMFINRIKKTVKRNYDKGIVTNIGRIKPLKIMEW